MLSIYGKIINNFFKKKPLRKIFKSERWMINSKINKINMKELENQSIISQMKKIKNNTTKKIIKTKIMARSIKKVVIKIKMKMVRNHK